MLTARRYSVNKRELGSSSQEGEGTNKLPGVRDDPKDLKQSKLPGLAHETRSKSPRQSLQCNPPRVPAAGSIRPMDATSLSTERSRFWNNSEFATMLPMNPTVERSIGDISFSLFG